MHGFSEYRKQVLREALNGNLCEDTGRLFDILRLDLHEVARLPLFLTEAYDGQAAELLSNVIKEDADRSRAIINTYINHYKREFVDHLREVEEAPVAQTNQALDAVLQGVRTKIKDVIGGSNNISLFL